MNTTLVSIEQQELTIAREQATRIIKFAQNDPTFLARAAQDPEGMLRAFGLPEQVIATFVHKPDVHANLPTCTDTTCWSSQCPATCYITIYTN
jgi:hypothetical protein